MVVPGSAGKIGATHIAFLYKLRQDILNPMDRVSEVGSDPGWQQSKSRRRINSTFWLVAVAALAFIFKVSIALNTLGTNDVTSFHRFAKALTEHGVEWTYTHNISFNHPPLTAYFLRAIYYLEQQPFLRQNGITFPFLLRLPGIIADLVVVLIFLNLGRREPRLRLPAWALAVMAISPVSLMISGFHGNTDPVMVMFLFIASVMLFREKPALCGLFFALSCQIKIIPLLLFPIFFFFWLSRGAVVSFLLPFALSSVVLWSEALLKFPMFFIKNVFSYGGLYGVWGITYWLRLTGWSSFGTVSDESLTPSQRIVGLVLKAFIVACVFLLAWRRRKLDADGAVRSIGYAWIIFFIFSPAVAPQYMVWLMPFLVLLSPPLFAYLTLASSLFLFFFYNFNSDAFPWYFVLSKYRPNSDWVPWSLWPWAILIAGIIVLWKGAVRSESSLSLFSFEPILVKPVSHAPQETVTSLRSSTESAEVS